MPYKGITVAGFIKLIPTDSKSLYLNTKAKDIQTQFRASIDEVSAIVTHLDKSVQVGLSGILLHVVQKVVLFGSCVMEVPCS